MQNTTRHKGSLSLLYVAGDTAQQSLLEIWASNQGWNVEFAHDAASGIEAAMMCRHDAILLDIDLSGGFSGLDVKAVLDDIECLRNIPVIGISNLVDKEVVECALLAGFAGYLAKPVDLMTLERAIQKAVLGRSKA